MLLKPISNIILLSAVCFSSCSLNQASSEKTESIQDTPIEINFETESRINNIEYIKDSLKLAAEQHKALHPNPLQLVKAEVLFDANFEPTLVAEVKNNRKTEVVAFEILINPNETSNGSCTIIKQKIKASILPGKSIKIKRKITEQVENGCLKIEKSNISLGDYILSNGVKKQPPNLFIEDNSDEE
jgi:hypothetical protein